MGKVFQKVCVGGGQQQARQSSDGRSVQCGAHGHTQPVRSAKGTRALCDATLCGPDSRNERPPRRRTARTDAWACTTTARVCPHTPDTHLELGWQQLEDVIDLVLEAAGQHLIGLIQGEHLDVVCGCGCGGVGGGQRQWW